MAFFPLLFFCQRNAKSIFRIILGEGLWNKHIEKFQVAAMTLNN